MRKKSATLLGVALAAAAVLQAPAQVYSPIVTRQGGVDNSDLHRMAEDIIRNAHAETPRQKAEAIWRYFLTDGRFVRPGIFYHIPGWAYEEPMGEVLDPIKLLNSYGFGLCYQDGPLLQATWEAAGFKSRSWFLTGHTVAEVFYDGAYHLYDADMLGYTTIGTGRVWDSPVASVQQIAAQPSILLDKLATPTLTRPGLVDFPWYPADVRAGAMDGYAETFSSRDDNYLYSSSRYSGGHTMDFVLRPGERMIRYYEPDQQSSRYMPYKKVGDKWEEFPKNVGEILLVKNGPRSEKDERRWSTGVLEYRPDGAAQKEAKTAGAGTREWVYRVSSPYVLIDAKFQMDLSLSGGSRLQLETSVDDGHTWTAAEPVAGPFQGASTITPAVVTQSEHGTRSAVAGTYGYLVRLKLEGKGTADAVDHLVIASSFEFNPRTLPELLPGANHLDVRTATLERHELPVHAESATRFAKSASNVVYQDDHGQGYLKNEDGKQAELLFHVSRTDGGELREVDAGGRFLDLSLGLAPDKLTAETRKITPWPATSSAPRSASIAWSKSEKGPWTTLWQFQEETKWPDGMAAPQQLRWPEVDRKISGLGSGSEDIYLRYQFQNIALDDVRLATMRQPLHAENKLRVTHCWAEGSAIRKFSTVLAPPVSHSYSVNVPDGASPRPVSLILSAEGSQPTPEPECVEANKTPANNAYASTH